MKVTVKSSVSDNVDVALTGTEYNCVEYLDILSSYFPECLRDGNILAVKDSDGSISIYQIE